MRFLADFCKAHRFADRNLYYCRSEKKDYYIINDPTKIWMCELQRQDTRFTTLNTASSTCTFLKTDPTLSRAASGEQLHPLPNGDQEMIHRKATVGCRKIGKVRPARATEL